VIRKRVIVGRVLEPNAQATFPSSYHIEIPLLAVGQRFAKERSKISLDHVTITREKITCAVDAKMDDALIQESLSPLMPRTRCDMLGGVTVQPLVTPKVQEPVHQTNKPFFVGFSLLASIKNKTLLQTPLLGNNSFEHVMPA
jgi:hypothetical protein